MGSGRKGLSCWNPQPRRDSREKPGATQTLIQTGGGPRTCLCQYHGRALSSRKSSLTASLDPRVAGSSRLGDLFAVGLTRAGGARAWERPPGRGQCPLDPGGRKAGRPSLEKRPGLLEGRTRSWLVLSKGELRTEAAGGRRRGARGARELPPALLSERRVLSAGAEPRRLPPG